MRNLTTEIDNVIHEVTSVLGNQLDPKRYQIIDRGVPHRSKSLPADKMAVYGFWLNESCLKIGKCGPNSNARFLSQHYNPGSSKSNLASSMLSDVQMRKLGINETNVGEWIKTNCRRIDILLDSNLGIFTLELIEAILHYKFEPIYEGFKTQR